MTNSAEDWREHFRARRNSPIVPATPDWYEARAEPAEVAEAVARLASWAEGRMLRGVGRVASTKLGQVDATSAPAVARTLRLVIESKTSAPE